MTSILTNTSATIALQTLRSINTQLDTTSNRVSTGQRISSAADGAAYWAIASTLKSDNGSLSALKDAMSLDKNSIDAASAGLNKVIDQLTSIKNALTSATSEQADKAKLQNDISVALSAIKNFSDNTVMNGSNWLTVDSGSSGTAYNFDKQLLSAFSRRGSTVDVSKTTLKTGSFVLYDNTSNATGNADTTVTSALTAIATSANTSGTVTVAVGSKQSGLLNTTYTITSAASGASALSKSVKDIDITATGVDANVLTGYLKIVDATAQQLLTGASVLGSMSTLLKSQSEFTQQLMDINNSSIGSLVDANIEEESTKLKALQTQQQLGIQSLSIANSSSQNVLSLFR
jgi:flagellin